jgi:CRISPR-associated protein Csd2
MTKMTTDTKAAPEVVTHRYDFVLLFDVQDGNPNGDPDGGNQPRMDPQTLQGLVTDGCLKRKIRNAVAVLGTEGGAVRPGYELYFQTQDAAYANRVLNLLHQRAYQAEGLATGGGGAPARRRRPAAEGTSTEAPAADPATAGNAAAQARRWMCRNFWDVRAFGAVMSMKENNCGQVRGPVQITFSRSIDPILPQDHSITRKSVTTEKEAEEQVGKHGAITGTMGRKNTVPYGLYRCHGFVNAYLARDTGFNADDLAMLWEALKGVMWDLDRSASRGLMATRGLYVFEHSSPLGSAPAHELFDRVRVDPLGPDGAPRSFDAYRPRVSVNDKDLPAGVTLRRMVG